MFISCLNVAGLVEDLHLPCVLWAGDALVRHSDGTEEIVHNVIVVPAAQSPYGYRYAYKLAKRACG